MLINIIEHVRVHIFRYPVIRYITPIATEATLGTGKYCSIMFNLDTFEYVYGR
jgi:hypothetical protein